MRMWISYRRFRRFRQIIDVMVRNGFGGLIESLRLRRIYGRGERDIYPSPRAKRLRLALEELGPTFIKVGQMLSTRADMVPPDIFEELQKLQDQVPPVPAEEIRPEIELELKSPIEAIFSEFDENPIAAASIGQVHKAQLKTGEKVAVKIQRPNIRNIIEEDIEILRALAGLAERHIPDIEIHDPTGFVNEFAKSIRQELDYTLEARNMERFAHNFADDNTIYVPKLYWSLTSGRILTMELIDGIKASQVEELKRSGYDTERIAVKGAEAYLKQIFIHRFFHGDPHPGNIFILPGEVIGIMDFGIMGRISPTMVTKLSNMLISIVRKDPDRIAENLLQISVTHGDLNVEDLKADVVEFVDKYYGTPLNQFQMSELVRDMSEISAKHKIRIDRQLSLLGKALAEIEGLGRTLDPDFDVMPLIEPFVKDLILSRNAPGELFSRSAQIIRDYADIAKTLPRDLQTAVEKAKSGKLRIEFKHVGLENLVSELERSTSRLAFSMIIAALVISSTLIIQLKPAIGPSLFGIPVIGALGYLIAAISGLWLLITIIRSRSLR